MMSGEAEAAGLAALAVCESLLLSLTENGVIDAAEAKTILLDAAAAHRGAVPGADDAAGVHEQAAALLEAIVENGNSVRRARPAPPANAGGPDTEAP
jgi:hypothetical protein